MDSPMVVSCRRDFRDVGGDRFGRTYRSAVGAFIKSAGEQDSVIAFELFQLLRQLPLP